jgi:hypothetical protein
MVLMTWKTPACKEISVKCEINSYACAELGQGSAQADLSGNIGNNFVVKNQIGSYVLRELLVSSRIHRDVFAKCTAVLLLSLAASLTKAQSTVQEPPSIGLIMETTWRIPAFRI